MVQIHLFDEQGRPVKDFHAGTPYVYANVHLAGGVRFDNILAMVDTGANGCSISNRLSGHLTEHGHVDHRTASGAHCTRYFKGSFEIIGLTQAVRTNIQELDQPFDAILGRNIMAGYCALFDSRNHIYKLE